MATDLYHCQVSPSLSRQFDIICNRDCFFATDNQCSLYGFFFIGLGSLGNAITCKRFYLPLIATFIILLFTVGSWTDTLVTGTGYLPTVSMVLGIVVCVLHLCHVIVLILPENWMQWTRHSFLLEHSFGSGVVLAESNIKQAGAWKLNRMTANALDLAEHKDPDAVLETHFGQSLLAFSRAGKKFKEAGGFLWTWRRIFSGEAFRKEGIWLSARLLASNMAQFIVSLFVLIAGIGFTQRVNEHYDVDAAKNLAGDYMALLFNRSVSDELVEQLAANYSLILTEYISNSSSYDETCATVSYANVSQAGCELVGGYFTCDPEGSDSYICTLLDYSANSTSDVDGLLALGLLNASGLDADRLVEASEAALQAAADASVDSLYPAQKYMVLIPCIIGCTVAFLTAVSLAITYIPSVMSTTLQLRSGVIRTLRNRRFNQYRVGEYHFLFRMNYSCHNATYLCSIQLFHSHRSSYIDYWFNVLGLHFCFFCGWRVGWQYCVSLFVAGNSIICPKVHRHRYWYERNL